MRTLPTHLTIALLGALAIGCALGGNRDPVDGGPFGATDAGSRDAGFTPGLDAGVDDAGESPGVDAGPAGSDAGPGGSDAGPGGFDAGRPDAGRSDAGGGGGMLDPRLEVPPSGETCATPGSLGECPSIQVCRFYTTTEGRCETCTGCGNLDDPCAASIDCDILFSCFDGRCTNFCTLGTFECGPVDDCIDVGHPTRGVCRPF